MTSDIRSDEQMTTRNAKSIIIDDPNDLARWSRDLGTTPEKLREAVEKVGNLPERVAEYLRVG